MVTIPAFVGFFEGAGMKKRLEGHVRNTFIFIGHRRVKHHFIMLCYNGLGFKKRKSRVVNMGRFCTGTIQFQY